MEDLNFVVKTNELEEFDINIDDYVEEMAHESQYLNGLQNERFALLTERYKVHSLFVRSLLPGYTTYVRNGYEQVGNDEVPKPILKHLERIYFRDLDVNTAFRNKNGKGAVYIKVELNKNLYIFTEDDVDCCLGTAELSPITSRYAMYEIATGKLFEPTNSPLEIVELKLKVSVPKPSIY
jgi:hypothetical protein